MFRRDCLEEELRIVKQIALNRMKTALSDRSAVYATVSEEEASTIKSRTSALFKLLISLDPVTISELFQVPTPPIHDSYVASNYESLSEYIYDRFKEKGTLDFGDEFGLKIEEVIGALMCHVWKTENTIDFDFTYLCNHLQMDEATYCMIKIGLRVKENAKMCQELDDSSCTGVDFLLTITMAHCEASKWPFTIDWSLVVGEERELTVDDLLTHDNLICEGSRELLENAREGDHDLVELRRLNKILQTTTDEITQKIEEVEDELKKLSQTDFPEMVEEHFTLVESRKEAIENVISEEIKDSKSYTEEEIKKLNADVDEVRFEKELIRSNRFSLQLPTVSFREKLALQRGQFCLARNSSRLNSFLPARICNQQSPTEFIVEFLENGSVLSLTLGDIANINVPMYDPSMGYNLNRFIGMRVIALTEHGKCQRWFPGTIGGALGSHGDSFLVFFDKNFDGYVDPVYQSEKRVAREFNQAIPPEDQSNDENDLWVRQHVDKMKMFPLCEQAFKTNGTEIERSLVCKLPSVTNNNALETFLFRYFDKFPYWPLVRMRRPVIGAVPQRVSIDDCKNGFVLAVDRAMCRMRFPKAGEPGDDCYMYPCRNKTHDHEDEWVYRGSTRITTMNLDYNNSNLSNRQKTRNQARFENQTNKKVTARKSTFLGDDEEATLTQLSEVTAKKEALNRLKIKSNKFNVIQLKCETITERHAPHNPCSNKCLGEQNKDPYDMQFFGISPMAIPMMCGWQRNVYQMSSNPTCPEATVIVIAYITPCSRTMRDLSQITSYLAETQCLLTIDLFTFSHTINPLKVIEVEKSDICLEDFTQGKETFPIPVVNSLDDEEPPKLIYGSRKHAYSDAVNISTIDKHFCSGCTCIDDCINPDKCECQRLTAEMVSRLADEIRPKTFGYQNRSLMGNTTTGIYECNENCGCNRIKCHNRVVQQEIKVPIQLFKTAGCGWGIRTAVDIPKGYFIVNYAGALMTDGIAEDKGREDDQYFADLDLMDGVELSKLECESRFGHLEVGISDESEEDDEDEYVPDFEGPSSSKRVKKPAEKKNKLNKSVKIYTGAMFGNNFKWSDYFGENEDLYVLDAKYKGNIGRFLNHSCDPNLFVQHILVDTHDLRLPWVGFFATRDILAGEELTWDYQYQLEESRLEHEQILCNCGTKLCKGRLL